MNDDHIDLSTLEADPITWIFTGRYRCLDNFYPLPLYIDGLMWPTSEHYYQAMKTDNPRYRNKVRNAKSPGEAKALGRDPKHPPTPHWEAGLKFDVMRRALKVKFDPEINFPIWAGLMMTGVRPIYEGNTWNDDIWGIIKQTDGSWSGKNHLGRMLMWLRDHPGVLYDPATSYAKFTHVNTIHINRGTL